MGVTRNDWICGLERIHAYYWESALQTDNNSICMILVNLKY